MWKIKSRPSEILGTAHIGGSWRLYAWCRQHHGDHRVYAAHFRTAYCSQLKAYSLRGWDLSPSLVPYRTYPCLDAQADRNRLFLSCLGRKALPVRAHQTPLTKAAERYVLIERYSCYVVTSNDAKLVHDLLVREVEDVADELVVEAESVLEVRRLKHGIADLLPDLRFDALDGVLQGAALDVVANKKEVDPALRILDEDAGRDDKLHGAGTLDLARDVARAHAVQGDEELLQRNDVLESGVERPTGRLHAHGHALPRLPAYCRLIEDAPADEIHLLQVRHFLAHLGGALLGTFRNLLHIVCVVRVEDEELHHLDLGGRTEELHKGIHGRIIATLAREWN